MKVVAFETGRTSFLFPLEEISPLLSVDGRKVVEGIVSHYNFRGYPPVNIPRDEIAKNGAKFENGLFEWGGQLISIADFTAYNDGIVVSSSTTEGALAFLDDLLSFLRENFGFRDFISKVQKTFVSQVVVEFDRPLSAVFPIFTKITAMIAEQTTETYGVPAKMDFARIDFEIDRNTHHLRYLVPRFLIERRPGTPFSQERYFCGAPMHTARHLALLEEIERMIPAS
ncbi:hypothetical protein AB7813_08980 [Tardiphaga sp. 20_F10_N6_6]|uniref:hypothetical protein n=1 Tax=Tardiphaga sp. 20_F10_N6_6 TaxID=3240788 RepID=UPI003F886F86